LQENRVVKFLFITGSPVSATTVITLHKTERSFPKYRKLSISDYAGIAKDIGEE
jgi:hypothetical protein